MDFGLGLHRRGTDWKQPPSKRKAMEKIRILMVSFIYYKTQTLVRVIIKISKFRDFGNVNIKNHN